MSDRYFIDTNIFVYSFDSTMPAKALRAAKLIRDGLDSGKGIVSYQVVQEFFNVAFRRFIQPMSSFAAEEYLNTVFRPMLAVHSSPALLVSALQVYSRHRFSWYDSLIVAAAQEADCSILYSENMQHGQRIDGLKVENPLG
ncbi:MAG TPA: PIN domain-containing protein [Candidatus Sulfotelmatobacter sp.]|jgi:predicted nucleic acid-binding protein